MLTEPANAYARRLNTWDAAMIVIGGVIGAGIFLTPATVARNTSSGAEVLILWAIGGLLTLAGVLCYAELGAPVASTSICARRSGCCRRSCSAGPWR